MGPVMMAMRQIDEMTRRVEGAFYVVGDDGWSLTAGRQAIEENNGYAFSR
jgi:hypothetical protein